MTDDKLDELEAKASKCIHKKWVVENAIDISTGLKSIWTSSGKYKGVMIADHIALTPAEYIAYADPQKILDLITSYRKLKERNEKLERVREAAKLWRINND